MVEKRWLSLDSTRNRPFAGKMLFFPLFCSVSCCSHFEKCIRKSLLSTFLSGAGLLQFMLQIAREQYRHKAYPLQKLLRKGILPQSVNMVLTAILRRKLKYKIYGKMPYVGKTKTKFRARLNNYKMGHSGKKQKLSQHRFHEYHLLLSRNKIDDWQFTLIEQCETHE